MTDEEFESGDVTSDGDVSREVIDGEEASLDQSAEESPKVKIKADVRITDTTGRVQTQIQCTEQVLSSTSVER